jgi:hypothetical protein
VGDMMKLQESSKSINGVTERIVKAIRQFEGLDQCHLGYLPRNLLFWRRNWNGVILVATYLYFVSENSQERLHSHQMGGLAKCKIEFVPTVQDGYLIEEKQQVYIPQEKVYDVNYDEESTEEEIEVFEDSGNENLYSGDSDAEDEKDSDPEHFIIN